MLSKPKWPVGRFTSTDVRPWYTALHPSAAPAYLLRGPRAAAHPCLRALLWVYGEYRAMLTLALNGSERLMVVQMWRS